MAHRPSGSLPPLPMVALCLMLWLLAAADIVPLLECHLMACDGLGWQPTLAGGQPAPFFFSSALVDIICRRSQLPVRKTKAE